MVSNTQSPFFPWPVRWFDIKLEPPPWGFVRTDKEIPQPRNTLPGFATLSPNADKTSEPEVGSDPARKTPGMILNELA